MRTSDSSISRLHPSGLTYPGVPLKHLLYLKWCPVPFPLGPSVSNVPVVTDYLKPIATEERRVEEAEKKYREEQERIYKQLAEGTKPLCSLTSFLLCGVWLPYFVCLCF